MQLVIFKIQQENNIQINFKNTESVNLLIF